MKTQVFIIDYMALARKTLSEGLAQDPSIHIMGMASNPGIGRNKLLAHPPDVMILDVSSSEEEGIHFLREIVEQYPLPIILLSALDQHEKRSVMKALHIDPAHVIDKPTIDVANELAVMMPMLQRKVRQAHHLDLARWKKRRRSPVVPFFTAPRLKADPDKVIAIGASTGGTEALAEILSQLPKEIPGIVIVQHMPGRFTRMFAERLNELSALEVKEAENGDEIKPGLALVAPGGFHMRLVRPGRGYKVEVKKGEKVNGHCPSVNVLMQSVAQHARTNALGVLLTGMGNDGAQGMKAMRDTGARTFAQDEKSSVVFGMPKEAFRCGGVEKLVPLKEIAKLVIATVKKG